jgi:hypothetical protein
MKAATDRARDDRARGGDRGHDGRRGYADDVMRRSTSRPLRYRGVRVSERGRPTFSGALLLSTAALVVTSFAVVWISTSVSNNIPGDVASSALFAALALWIDWRAIRAWREIVRFARSRKTTDRRIP